MEISAIRVRYAKAFFSLAKEKKMIQTFKADIEKVYDTCKHSSELVQLLESPVVSILKKTELITKLFKPEVNQYTLRFLLLILHNNRGEYIPGICHNFLEQIREDQNIKSAKLVTAIEIDAKAVNKIKILLEKELKSTVELNNKVDPKIIGGLILRIDDKQYDASVITQLGKVKKSLLETELKN